MGAAVALVALLTASAALAKPLTKTVIAGPSPVVNQVAAKLLPKSFNKTYNPDINAFFNKKTTINVGDTVSFQIRGFHDIDIPAKGGRALPLLVPGKTATGNDFSGNPFWWSGRVPIIGFNPALLAPGKSGTYNGKKRLDSGLPLGKPKPFNITFTKPGTYKYFCDVHPGMVGTVVVKPAGAAIPSAKQDAKAAVAQATADIKAGKKAAAAAAKQPADTISLGASAPGGVELYDMFPSSLTVNAGTTVTFQMSKSTFEVHTATFGDTKTLTALAKGFQGVPFPAQGVYPSDPPGTITESLTSHGNGFANTGALDRNSATAQILPSSQIKFTQAGTYHFICLIHPFMHGTIIVK
jgi:plastocyanin